MTATTARARARRTRRLAGFVTFVLVAAGVVGARADAASAAAPRPSLPQSVCELAGGLFVQEDGYFLCYLPDGSVVICVDGVGCTSVPAPRRAAVRVADVPLTPLTAA
jgi:hypothetical protein